MLYSFLVLSENILKIHSVLNVFNVYNEDFFEKKIKFVMYVPECIFISKFSMSTVHIGLLVNF